MTKYSLYGSIITNWKRETPNKLILQVDLSNLNQPSYSEDQQDFRPMTLIFEIYEIIDELNEGFDGFLHGDARIIEASELKKDGSSSSKQGIKLVMMHDTYDGTEEKLISVVLLTNKVSMSDSNNSKKA